MDELKKLLEKNPKAKEEFDNIVTTLSDRATGQIKRLLGYIGTLEDMIEHNDSREEMLKKIDSFNGWTVWFREDGILEEEETWWENALEGYLITKREEN